MMACTGSLDDPAAEVARKAGATVIVDRQETIDWTNPKVRHLDAGIHAARWLVTWSWDCGDWAGGAEPNAPIRAAHPGDILLMHDGPTRDETARRRTSKALDALATMGPKLEALEDP